MKHCWLVGLMVGVAFSAAAQSEGVRVIRAARLDDGPPFPPPKKIVLTSQSMTNRMSIHFTPQPFSACIDKIARNAKVQYTVRWERLEAAHFTLRRDRIQQAPVSVTATNVTAYKALEMVSDALVVMQHGTYNLAYAIDEDGILVISTLDDLEPSPLIVRHYEVADLLPKARTSAASRSGRSTGPDRDRMSALTQLCGEIQTTANLGLSPGRVEPERHTHELDKLKRVWSVRATSESTLTVTTSPAQHRSIVELLDKKRNVRRPDPSQRLMDQLDWRADYVSFKGTTFVNAIEYLRRDLGLNIEIDWDHMAEHGIDRYAPIDIDYRDASFREVLGDLLFRVATRKTAINADLIRGKICIWAEPMARGR